MSLAKRINTILKDQHLDENIAHLLINLEGNKYSLEEHRPYKYILSSPFRKIVIQSGRQVAKSTFLSVKLILLSIYEPFFRSLFVSTSENQMNDFSRSRIARVLNNSPLIQELYFRGKGVMDNISYKQIKNSAELYFRYASDNADRCRGISADLVCLDECQDMSPEIVPVIKEVLRASLYKLFYQTGTPKTEEHYLSWAYNNSVKHEWLIPCYSCKLYNIPDLNMVGKSGLICKKCGKPVDAKNGFWHTNTPRPYEDWEELGPKGLMNARSYGFRIPQLIISHITNDPLNWADLLDSLDKYGEEKVNNEILGLPYDLGSRLITRDELNNLCIPNAKLEERPGPLGQRYPLKIAGIDWSGGGLSGRSRTSLVIYGYNQGTNKLHVLYYKIFPVGNPIGAVREIAEILGRYLATTGIVIGADSGEGAIANLMLNELLYGKTNKKFINTFQFGDFKKGAQYDKHNEHIQVNRTQAINSFFHLLIKQQTLTFPQQDLCTPLFNDFLAEFETTSERTNSIKTIWKHHPDVPDDALMAAIFGWLTLRFCLQGQTDFVT